jgi:predicted permease
MLLRIASILLPVLSIVLIGYLYGRRHAPDMVTVNRINMDLFVPALVFVALAGKDVQLAQYGWLALAAAGVVLGSGLLAWPLARLLGIAPLTFVPPMMFNNSGNMGLPLIVLAFGAAALPGAVILFLVEMILHFSLGLWLMDRHAPIGRLFRQPVVIATLAGLAVSVSISHSPSEKCRIISTRNKITAPGKAAAPNASTIKGSPILPELLNIIGGTKVSGAMPNSRAKGQANSPEPNTTPAAANASQPYCANCTSLPASATNTSAGTNKSILMRFTVTISGACRRPYR